MTAPASSPMRETASGLETASGRHRVVVVGAGFGGLEVVQRLAGSGVAVTLVDRRNHHLFQPLLYQVAGASLSRCRRVIVASVARPPAIPGVLRFYDGVNFAAVTSL